MDGTKDLILKSKAFLMAQGNVELKVAQKGLGVQQGGFFHLLAKGQGTLGISANGGLISINLSPNEECIIQPKYSRINKDI
jgi:uncharacterized protein (AIM24 family)